MTEFLRKKEQTKRVLSISDQRLLAETQEFEVKNEERENSIKAKNGFPRRFYSWRKSYHRFASMNAQFND